METATATLARRASRLNATMPIGHAAEAISFESGHAFPGILPDMTEAAAVALNQYRAETLQYAPRPGLAELRAWIAEFMQADGIAQVGPDDVLVVNGAKHGLDLICRALLDEGDCIAVTAPTYFTAVPIFRSFGVQFLEIPQDAQGMDVSKLEAQLNDLRSHGKPLPKFVYDVPDFHNPSGVTMSLERRRNLIALCARNNIFIVEDSPYRSVRFEGELPPPLKALDGGNTVLMLGTFSKLLAPGLRIGWVSGPRELLARMVQLKSDGGTCPLTQRIILEFCKAGNLPSHIARVRETYRAQRDRMIAALRRELPQCSFSVPGGGYYLWITLPAGLDGDALAHAAARDGVNIIAGSRFFAGASGEQHRNTIRVAYSYATQEQIDRGVALLAGALRDLQS